MWCWAGRSPWPRGRRPVEPRRGPLEPAAQPSAAYRSGPCAMDATARSRGCARTTAAEPQQAANRTRTRRGRSARASQAGARGRLRCAARALPARANTAPSSTRSVGRSNARHRARDIERAVLKPLPRVEPRTSTRPGAVTSSGLYPTECSTPSLTRRSSADGLACTTSAWSCSRTTR